MRKGVLTTLGVVAIVLAGSGVASAEIAPDETFEKRRKQVLKKIAKRYTGTPSGQACNEVGTSALGLVARFELAERGLSGGIKVSSASGRVEKLAARAKQWTYDCDDPCTWGEAGNPTTMHAFLGLGMILHRYKSKLSSNAVARIKEAARGWWRAETWTNCKTDGSTKDEAESPVGHWLANGNIAIVAGHLLVGEVMGTNSEVWRDGKKTFDKIYKWTMNHGGLEMNAPIYTAYQLAALTPLLELNHKKLRRKARILLDYLFLVQAHLYLPGGGLGAPQARDYGGGDYDSYPSGLNDLLWLYTGEAPFTPTKNVNLIGAAVDYRLPEIIRSIFLNKGDGYDFWAYTPAPVADDPKQGHDRGYDFGTAEPIAPWRAVVTPDAMFGVNHGARYQSIHVSMGVYARTKPQTFPILYQYEPDVANSPPWLPTEGSDTDPDDFEREMYHHRRMVYGRTMISLWKPGKWDTRVHIPDYADFGGSMKRTGGWFVGKAGDSYIAYHPLGTIQKGPVERSSNQTGSGTDQSGDYFYLRLDGQSGGIVELATTDEFETLGKYANHLKNRRLTFNKGPPMQAEFEAHVPGTGSTKRIRLQYDPEKHWVGGDVQPLPQSLDHGLVDSPFLNLDSQSRRLTVSRGCHPRMVYDLDHATVKRKPPKGPNCVSKPLEGTKFSDVPYSGDFANYKPEHPDRWAIVRLGGDRRLYLGPYDFTEQEDRLGEIARIAGRSYSDFRLELRAKTHEDLEHESAADYAVVFGYQDHDNYYFLLANSHMGYSELFVLEHGKRTRLAGASTPLIPDEGWHELVVRRERSAIEVSFDGSTVMSATDETFGRGAVGVGSLNNSVLFDDIDVQRPGSGDDAGPIDTGTDTADTASERDGGTSEAGAADSAPGTHQGCPCSAGGSTAPPIPAVFFLVLLARLRARSRGPAPLDSMRN